MVVSQRCSFPLDPFFLSLSLLLALSVSSLPPPISSFLHSCLNYRILNWLRQPRQLFQLKPMFWGRWSPSKQRSKCPAMSPCVIVFNLSGNPSLLVLVTHVRPVCPVMTRPHQRQTVLGEKCINSIVVRTFSLFSLFLLFLTRNLGLGDKLQSLPIWMKKESTCRLSVAYMGINWSYWVWIHRKGLVFVAPSVPKQLGRPRRGRGGDW